MQLKLIELFAISRIVNLSPNLGHRTIMSSFIREFTKIQEFNDFINWRSSYEQLVVSIVKKYEETKNSLIKELNEYSEKKVSDVPNELKDKITKLNTDIKNDIWENTKEIREKLDLLMESKDLYEIEISEKMKNTFKKFMEEDNQITNLKLNEKVIEMLVSVYQRI